MAERTTRVTLNAQIQGYVDGMHKAAQATRETGTEAEKLAQKGEAFERLGRAAMVAGGTIMAGLALATKAAIDWDSAWAGVTKTVDGTDAEMAVLEQQLRNLAQVLPATHEEIAAVAEAAGQLGIKRENVAAFTKTMIDLGETTNLSADQAATSLARFMNVMGTSQGDVERLGSSLVELGNNYATTESEILEMSQRLAGAGAQINMSEGQVLGLATALSSVGIEAEAGGSAMSKVMIDIASSVDKGGERLEQFAKVAGVSADTFAQKWSEDPGAALALFVQGLADAEAQGSSTFAVLEELGITEVRMRDALLRSAAAAGQFSEAMATGNDAMEANTALSAEAEKRYETTAAKLEIVGNKINDMAIGIGEKLLPLLEYGAESVGQFADMISGLGGPMESFVAWGGLIVGTGLLGAGLWVTAVPKIAEYRKALDTLNLTGGKLHRTFSIVTRALGGVATIAVIASLIREAEDDVTELNNALERNAKATDLVGSAAEALSRRGWNEIYGELGKVEVAADDVTAALEYMQESWIARSTGWATAPKNFYDTSQALKVLGNEIANVASLDLSSAQDALRRLSDEYSWTKDQMWAFIENSPNLKKALEEQAGAFDLGTDKADLLKIAFGEVKPAADDATAATEENADALAQLEGKAVDTKGEIDSLADAIRGFGSAELDAREANRQLEESFDSLAESVAENGNTLDISTEQGRANEAAIDGVARAALEAAAATLEQTGSQEQANQVLANGRERLKEMLAQFGITGDAADRYVDRLGLIPKNIDTYADVHTAQAERDLANLTRDRYVRIATWVDSSGNARIDNWAFQNADGGLYAYANGGIESYANGGLPSGIYSGGRPIYKFAEPETRWEAFISGKPGQEERNRQVWLEAGNRLGALDELRNAISSAMSASSIDGARFELVLDDGTPLTGFVRRVSDSVVSARGASGSSTALNARLGAVR